MPKAEATSFRGGTVGIASGGTESEVVDFQAADKGGFIIPAAFTGTAITFKVCDTPDGTFIVLKDDSNNPVSITVGASSAHAFPSSLAPWKFFLLVSGTAEAAAREIQIMTKY